jgi:hypothetical protein
VQQSLLFYEIVLLLEEKITDVFCFLPFVAVLGGASQHRARIIAKEGLHGL